MGVFHDFFYEGAEFGDFGFGSFEEEFVVHLEGHFRLKFFGGEAAIELDHGEFDEVGGGALHGRVHGGAFGEVAHVRLGRIDFRDGADAAEHGFDVAGFAGVCDLGVEEFFHAAVAFKIDGDEVRGFFLFDAELLRETRKPIDRKSHQN